MTTDPQVSAGKRLSQDMTLADFEADHGMTITPAAWLSGIEDFPGELTRVEMSWEVAYDLIRLWNLTSHIVNPKPDEDDEDPEPCT